MSALLWSTVLWSTVLWSAVLLAPLLLVGAMLVPRARRVSVVLAPLACLPALALAALGDRVAGLEVPWLLLGSRLALDDVSRPLLLLTALLYAAALLASRVERADDPRRTAFVAVFLVTFTGNVMLLVAADVVTFYVGFTVMSLTAYGLVVHSRTARAMRAGRVYVALALVGEVLLLAGILLAVRAAGSTALADIPAGLGDDDGLTVGLLVAGLGVKTGLVPLHVWLPLAHPAAPAPASAVLSGAMVKAGLVGWLRLLPLGEVAMPTAGGWMVGLGLVGVFGAVVVGLVQTDPKVQLAYSTISQMGFITVVVGAGLREPAVATTAVAVAVVYALAHGATKGSLFMAVPVWKAADRPWRRHATLIGVAVAGLSLAGLPLLGSFVAKYGLKEVAEAAGVPTVLLSLGAVGTTLIIARFAFTLAATAPASTHRVGAVEVGWLVLLVAGPVLVWAQALTTPEVPLPPAGPGTWWDATWPVLLGLSGVVGALTRSRSLARTRGDDGPDRSRPGVPEGDLVVLLEPAVLRGLAGLDAAGRVPGDLVTAVAGRTRRLPPVGELLADGLVLPGWRRLGPLFVVALLGLVLVLL